MTEAVALAQKQTISFHFSTLGSIHITQGE
jgi:hypothetical protein